MQGNERVMGKPRGRKKELFSSKTGHPIWGGPGATRTNPFFTHLPCVFHSVPLFSHPPPACLIIQEEEAEESNIVLEIGLEGQ